MNDGTALISDLPIKKRELLIIDAVLLGVGLLAPFLARLLLALPTDCYVQKIGYLCPACGGTRSVLLLFRGEMIDAFRMNAFFVLSALFALSAMLLIHISVLSPKHYFAKLCRGILHPGIAVIWAVCFVLFGILRNIISL